MDVENLFRRVCLNYNLPTVLKKNQIENSNPQPFAKLSERCICYSAYGLRQKFAVCGNASYPRWGIWHWMFSCYRITWL